MTPAGVAYGDNVFELVSLVTPLDGGAVYLHDSADFAIETIAQQADVRRTASTDLATSVQGQWISEHTERHPELRCPVRGRPRL